MARKTTTGTRAYRVGDDARRVQVQFRVTAKEAGRLEAEAQRRGFDSFSGFARYVCLQALPDLDSAEAELKEVTDLEQRVQALAATIRARHGMGGKKVQ